jgi:hypothetical protein
LGNSPLLPDPIMFAIMFDHVRFRSRLKWALSNLVASLRWNLFAYRDLWAWIDDPYSHPPNQEDAAQLSFFLDSTATP